MADIEGSYISELTQKTKPDATDLLILEDSEDTKIIKYSNLKKDINEMEDSGTGKKYQIGVENGLVYIEEA
jgi:hypothetical protein